jgi:hypothetical protein
MLLARVHAAYPRPCCMFMFARQVCARAPCSCLHATYPYSMSMLNAHAACLCCMSILLVHDACPCCMCPCCIFMMHVHAIYPHRMSMLQAYAACPCCMSMLIVHIAYPWCMSILYIHAPCPCGISMHARDLSGNTQIICCMPVVRIFHRMSRYFH